VTDHEDDADPDIFFTKKRGIPAEIWRSRPYLWWTPEHPEPAKEPFADLSAGQRQHIAKIVRQAPGWVIHRSPPPLWPPRPKIYPELRPVNPDPNDEEWRGVKTRGPQVHWHGNGPEPEGLKPWHRLPGGPGSKTWRAHIGRDKTVDDHHGVNTEEVHSHQKRAKYVFPSAATLDGAYVHDHETAWRRRSDRDRPAYHDAHIAKRHGGMDAVGPHVHSHRAKDRTKNLARRIDVHPLAVPLLREAEVVFFVIEGCIKADAVLAAGGAVFSVPSVSLWDCEEELEEVADAYLEDKTVVIVPDADWHDNELVINQARLCQNKLIQYAARSVHVAAPPRSFKGESTKGVDDFIGAGGELADLEVIDHDPAPGLTDFVLRNWSWRRDRLRRDNEVLAAFANFTGSSGELRAPLRTVARVMGEDVKRVSRAVYDLAQIGAVTIDGDLAARRGWFDRHLEWSERPAIVLHPELRSTERQPTRLGDLVDNPTTLSKRSAA
jgi:hypothetical protein